MIVLILAANLCVAQRNSVSLPQLNLLQRIDIRCRFVWCAAKFCFAAASKPAAAIWYSLPICVLRSEILFRCRSWTFGSEVIFAAELCVAQRNCDANSDAFLAAELAACGEPALAAELGSLQRTSFRYRTGCLQQNNCRCWTGSLRRTSSRCRVGQPAANQFSLPISTISLLGRNDLNASNNFMIWWCKIWNTWMWTYELLK